MSTTATTFPSPQSAWFGHANTSTTPVGLPPRTPASVGQLTTSWRDTCGANNYFGLVVESPHNSPTSNHCAHTRSNWDQSASRNSSPRCPSESNELDSQSKPRRTSSVRHTVRHDVCQKPTESSTIVRHDVGHLGTRSPGYGGEKSMDIDPPTYQVSNISSSSELRTRSFLPSSVPLAFDARRDEPRLSLPLQTSRHPLGISGVYSLHRSETSPPSVDQGGVKMISPTLCLQLLESQPDTTLLLDVRPYPQFSQSRIRGALNLCIPTTLLKRPSFNLKRLEDTFMDEKQKKRFMEWRRSARIVVYDSMTTHMKDASGLVNVLKKFTNEGWNGEPMILRGGFTQFSAECGDSVETTRVDDSDCPSGLRKSPPSVSALKAPLVVGGCPIPESSVAPNPFFGNIRQNMDLIGGVGQMPVKLPSTMSENVRRSLPLWLRKVSDARDDGKLVAETFLRLEKAEQSRMQEALRGNVSYGQTSSGISKPFQIAGIEKGSKNRYNNIYPYDHSRVRLEEVSPGHCDYVNASYIQASGSNKRYIATQAPIPGTFADFWKVVWEQDVRVIVMLTAETEGVLLKCHPYWHTGHYGSMRVELFKEECVPLASTSAAKPQIQDQQRSVTPGSSGGSEREDSDTPYLIIRHLSLRHSLNPFQPMREVRQIQYSNWPDFGAPTDPKHLIQLIEETNNLAAAANGCASNVGPLMPAPEGQRRVLVHCSAGCGRTGTFCAVDSVIDMLKRQRSEATGQLKSEADWVRRNDIDLIAKTVEEFRLQRLSMVQSLTQFVLCYKCVSEWIASLGLEWAPEEANNIDPK